MPKDKNAALDEGGDDDILADIEGAAKELGEADEPIEGDEPAVQAEEEIAPPEHWSQLDKDKFNSLPKEIRPLYLENRKSLEDGYNQKFREVADFTKERESLKQIFAPYENQLHLAGKSYLDIVRRMAGYHEALSRRDPNALAELAREYGIELGGLAAQQPEASGYLDPMAEREIQSLKAQLQQLTGAVQTTSQSMTMQRQQQLDAAIHGFQSSKNTDGSPKYPYFAEVRPYMASFLQSGQAQTLEDAYDRAIWAHPEVRARVLERQRHDEAKKKEAERKAEAEKARKAAGLNVSGTGKPARGKSGKFVKDDVEAAWDELAA